MGTWVKGAKYKEMGRYQGEHMYLCVEPFTVAPLTRVLGWSVDECQVLMAAVRKEMRDAKNHFYTVFHYVQGRKPS